eukprot:m.67770 g.67770  ORF g.67770 m.67770 type:complete len:458 (+) comp8227_c1_seq1:33-1406(+)
MTNGNANNRGTNWMEWVLTSETSLYTQKIIKAAAIILFGLTTILGFCWLTSTLFYSMFYMAFVPISHQEFPIYFNFNKEQPIANIHFNDALQEGQAYDFEVRLKLPNSDLNQNRGMFMVSMFTTPTMEDFYSKKHPQLGSLYDKITKSDVQARLSTSGTEPGVFGRYVTGVSRPALLPYVSPMLHTIRRVVFWFPYLFELMEDESIITVEMKNTVRVGEKGVNWGVITLSHNDIHVSEATLISRTNMQGTTYWMYHWFFSSFVFATSMLTLMSFSFVVAIILLCCRTPLFAALELEAIRDWMSGTSTTQATDDFYDRNADVVDGNADANADDDENYNYYQRHFNQNPNAGVIEEIIGDADNEEANEGDNEGDNEETNEGDNEEAIEGDNEDETVENDDENATFTIKSDEITPILSELEEAMVDSFSDDVDSDDDSDDDSGENVNNAVQGLRKRRVES